MQAVSGLNAIFSQSVLCMTLTLTCADKKCLVSPQLLQSWVLQSLRSQNCIFIYLSIWTLYLRGKRKTG